MESNEASVDSKDREQRILARRARIQEKLAAKESGEAGTSVNVHKKKETDRRDVLKGKQQIQESGRKLRHLLEIGDEHVTKVRVEGDNRENQRRINEEARRLDRRQKLLFEAESSARRNAAIAMKWASLFEKEIPLDLLNDMQAQQEACGKVINQKDELIKEFQLALRAKDEEYVKSLKRWAEDIDALLSSMTEQFREQQTQYELETQEIEAVFMHERKELIEANKREMELLMEKRRNMEGAHMEERQKRIEHNQEQLQRNRLKDSEAYTEKKITLETEIQKLEQQLEVMRATYQLNTEKLEYNFRVLSERDLENSNTINQQKRKLARLQDNLSSLMSKYSKTDKQYKQNNIELTEEYRRITEQFQDLQGKFRHFQMSDSKKFDEVWAMKEGQVKEMLGLILQADKIIHEQQLGLYWYPPNEEVVNAAFQEARVQAKSFGKKRLVDNKQQDNVEQMLNDVSPEVKRMFTLLCDQAGFLVENKVRKLIDTIPRTEGDRMKVESILKALSVTNEQDIEHLQRFFFTDDDQGEPELISADTACLAIKQFLKEQRANTGQAASAFPRQSPEEDGEEHAHNQATNIWELCTTIIAPKTYRVWGALETFMIKYNSILKERSNSIDESARVRTQNDELKMLLNQYLGSKVNQELYVPPTATISRLAQ
jgi:dynein regulatory complex protein 1